MQKINNKRFIFFILSVIAIIIIIVIANNKPYLNNTDAKKLISEFNNDDNCVTILIIGQSNAANYADINNTVCENIYNYSNHKIYLAKDPLKGSSGEKGSIWIPFAKKLIDNHSFKKILLITIAQGSSTINDWSKQGKHYSKLISCLNNIKKDSILINYIFWQQGEEDNLLQTKKNNYINSFNNILSTINDYCSNYKLLISLTTYSPTSKTPINNQLREAQITLIETYNNTYLGPDTDNYTKDIYRYDGIHFSKDGAINIARDWASAIKKLE